MKAVWMVLVLVAAPVVALADDGPRISKCEAACAREFAKNRESDRCNDEMDMNCHCSEKLDACRKKCFQMQDPRPFGGQCNEGMELMKDKKHCCYPGQSWSVKKDECVGLPTKCPEGLEPARLGGSNKGEAPEGDSCHDPKMIRFVHREQERDKERRNVPPSARAWNLRAHEVVNALEHDGVAGQWAERIVAIAHPSSGNRELLSITADEVGEWERVELTAGFRGGLSGTQYRILVRLDISPTKGLIDSRIVSDNAPFAVAASNKAQLEAYFTMMASQITEGVK